MVTNKPRLMLVEWFDSAWNPSTHTLDELRDFSPVHMITVGFGIELEDRFNLAKECQDDSGYRYVSSIPKVNIKSVRYLRPCKTVK